MIRKNLLFFTMALSLQAAKLPTPLETGMAVVPQDKAYYTHKLPKSDVELIYTKDNMNFAKEAAGIEVPLHKDYEKFYDWKLDETLHVGLISDNNQVANGFSNQLPNNRQINYIGGTSEIDYFSTTSWLDTLLYHETAHNYQVNVKGSAVSRTLHTIFGNGMLLLPIPFIVPNTTENSFMLEGNAVLNESRHGNGGRLYSGRFVAETMLQAKAGNLKPEYVYNNRLAFPYSEIPYIQGGFYNLYMAKKYGLKGIDSYFLHNSYNWFWPFYTNDSMKQSVGIDFEHSLKDFANEQKSMAKNLVEARGKHLASSQFFSSLGNSADEIFFIVNTSGVSFPKLVVLDKKSEKVTKERDSWLAGKVVKIGDKYFTQGSMKTSPIRTRQGLFDSAAYIKKGTASKMVQAYLSDGRAVYFDVASSYSQPQLYVGNKFYAQVNSSVIVDKNDNLYYFKQDGKTRTLYKNKTALFSYKGFYGIVSDVDSKGRVYFVSNSKYGSSLYRYANGKVERVSSADNIVEARLVNDNEVLLAAISAKDYYYVINPIDVKEESPFERKLFFENKDYYGAYKVDSASENLKLNDNYYSFLDMHYSGTDFSMGQSTNGTLTGSLNIKVGDPLSQNSANAFITRDDTNITIAGAGYTSSQYLLNYTIIGYGVVDKSKRTDVRDGGVMASATLPFLTTGYFYGALGANYFQDYDTLEREPLSTTLTLSNSKKYGMSMYVNSLNALKIYGVNERGDTIVGGVYSFKHDLPYEFYVGMSAKYSRTDGNKATDSRGVKLSTNDIPVNMDPSTIDMPSLSTSHYVKSAGYGELSLAKVLNFSAYYFTFPISLQRESLYTKFRHYSLEEFTNGTSQVNETRVGITLSTILLNSRAMPVSLEYIYNDSALVRDKESVRFVLGSSF